MTPALRRPGTDSVSPYLPLTDGQFLPAGHTTNHRPGFVPLLWLLRWTQLAHQIAERAGSNGQWAVEGPMAGKTQWFYLQ